MSADENASILTVADLRELVKQLRAATPICPNCKHPIHKAFTCGMKLDASGKPVGPRTCDCNWSFQLSPLK